MFESSFSNRSVRKNHKNVICAKRLIVEKKVIIVFCPRTILWENNLNLKLKLQFQLQNSLLHS